MITIKKNGKFIIPEKEIFIGHAGDNLNETKEFFVENVTDVSLVYRMYLQFDDGTTNFFLLESESLEKGTKLIWNVTSDQIYKGGIVKMQIKASNSSGVVFHSAITSLVVHTSIEFGEVYKNKENSEFLQHEQFLNDLLEKEQAAYDALKEYSSGITDGSLMDSEPSENSVKAVTSGGIYNALKSKLSDTDGSVKSNNIADGAVTNEKLAALSVNTGNIRNDAVTEGKIAASAVTTNKIADGAVTEEKLSESLKDTINYLNSTDYMTYHDAGELSERTSLNNPMYADFTSVWQFTASGELANSIKGESSAITAELRYIAPYQIVTDVETQQAYIRKINSIAPSFSANSWEKKSLDGVKDGYINSMFVAYSDTVFDENVDSTILYRTSYEGSLCYFFTTSGAGLYQYRFTRGKIQTRYSAGVNWQEWKTIGDNTATSERVNITESTNNFTGSYELAENTITVSGIVSISAASNTGRITPSEYTPTNTACTIGRGISKYYIISASTSAPSMRFTVLNMDGTTPTEADTVRFTATLFKT